MWWNFVARTREEISAAYDDWAAAGERFGTVDSRLPRITTAPPLWHPRAELPMTPSSTRAQSSG